MAETLLSVRDLKVHFPYRGAVARAVDGVSFDVAEGETLGLLGESGCGKTTLGPAILFLQRATSGEVLYRGRRVHENLRPFRRHMQMIFQDPYASLDPRQTVGKLIAEGPIVHGAQAHIARQRALQLLDLVGLDARAADRYPHEFSGGQRQRIALARALALDPEILIADEPVSALDVSVQAQVLRLLAEIRERLSLAMLFITHDLRVAAQVCDTIAVMRRGEIVEYGRTADVFAAPKHPYTRELFAAVPGRAWSERRRMTDLLDGGIALR